MFGIFSAGSTSRCDVASTAAPDLDAGSVAIAETAFALIAFSWVVSGNDFAACELWPFLLLRAFVPGLSQLLVVHAVRAAGASRAGVLFGMARRRDAVASVQTSAVTMWLQSVRRPSRAGMRSV